MIKAFFVDFYGTVVHEDGDIVKKISKIITDTGNGADASEVDGFWWNDFKEMFHESYGDHFEKQRTLETRSIQHTLEKFDSHENAEELSDMLFEQWVKPPIFEDAKEFFDHSPIPIYILSNIDKEDINAAIDYHGLDPAGVFTSEDAKSYKPCRKIFDMALQKTGLKPNEVIHIGDSIGSDVKGAKSMGIRALWLNRSDKEVPSGVKSISTLDEAIDLL